MGVLLTLIVFVFGIFSARVIGDIFPGEKAHFQVGESRGKELRQMLSSNGLDFRVCCQDRSNLLQSSLLVLVRVSQGPKRTEFDRCFPSHLSQEAAIPVPRKGIQALRI